VSDFDAIVIGGGVAGCATAVDLTISGQRVVVLQHKPDPIDAVESVSAAAGRDLLRLCVEVGSELPEVAAWWGSDICSRQAHPGARVVRRRQLTDALRARAAARGVTFVPYEGLEGIDRSVNGWRARFKGRAAGHPSLTLTAEVLTDASGRSAVLARRLGARRIPVDHLCCASMDVREPGITGTWTESVPNGWWNLCALPEYGTLSFYSTALTIRQFTSGTASGSQISHNLRSLLGQARLGDPIARACGSSQLDRSAGDGWIAVGDAASTFQPLASAGIAKALSDAEAAQHVFEGSSAIWQSHQATQFGDYLMALRSQYRLERRWVRSPFWTGMHRSSRTVGAKPDFAASRPALPNVCT
jgi:flavin-dependent dehydrogenase